MIVLLLTAFSFQTYNLTEIKFPNAHAKISNHILLFIVQVGLDH